MTGPSYHGMIIAGFGGQGVVLAGKLIASAAVREGREVVWAPSYGPEMRGGPVQCTVIVSAARIGSPEVSLADSLLLMDQASAPKFASRVRPSGLVLLNSTLVKECAPPGGVEVLRIPGTEAAEALGDQRVANVIMLGAFLARRPVVSADSLVAVMREMAGGKEKLLDINLRAMDRGRQLAEDR